MARPTQRVLSMPMAASATPKRPHRLIDKMIVMAKKMMGTSVLLYPKARP